jgi:hypothetical protein
MTLRERILAVYQGRRPDCVPFMLDLSHWFYHKHRLPWDLSKSYDQPEFELIDYHQKNEIGFYLPNLGSFYSAQFAEGYASSLKKHDLKGETAITWTLHSPTGSISRTRIWHEISYSWAIADWSIHNEHDLRILGEVMSRRSYLPRWDRYEAWRKAVGDLGVVYVSPGYSAMGQLLNYWMGVEGVTYAAADWPETMKRVVDQINANQLQLIDLLAASPAEIILMGDNFSSDIQPPHFFAQWSADYYREAIRRLHAAGKQVAVHIDGRLRGSLKMFAGIGADCADAVTPTPMGDLTPGECRDEAGPNLILSGGVSPNLWLPEAPEKSFIEAVRTWLALRREHPRLIANAGDQVPPGADEKRIVLMRDLVEAEGRF